ncbi:MAG: S8 family serine peptidase [Sediminibacterium sp.]|nr:S8 family serine peptidase [Sediminibacterium sp.]
MTTLIATSPEIEKRVKFTGKQLVLLDKKANSRSIAASTKNASLKLASFSDYKSNVGEYRKAFNEGDGIVFDQFGIAVINENREDQISVLTSSRSRSTFLYSEPERYVYAIGNNEINPERRMTTPGKKSVKQKKGALHPIAFTDTKKMTWGLQAINVHKSEYTGKGVKLAILDTGFNLAHPDFEDRIIVSKSFVTGQEEDDRNGHGSHCAGIAVGGANHKTGKRYGVASEASLYVGKVLSNAGVGSDSSILAGMEWAIVSNCKIISMSLGSAVEVGESYSRIYNNLAAKALKRGTIIIAAAGNESERGAGIITPVGHPANCPSIMSVAAVDRYLDVADFSCGSNGKTGGQVDIAAPGVDIYSAWKQPRNYKLMDGTSMATPYVAGIAALLWEADPDASASEIWMRLTQLATRLKLKASDIGVGLAQVL